MKFQCALLVVEDLARSRRFYEELLGQDMIADLGEHISFSGDFALQSRESWLKSIGGAKLGLKGRPNNYELYFEEKNFDDFIARLKVRDDIEYVTDLQFEPSGQACIRFYDPDGHIIEVGESMKTVVRRLSDNGMRPADIAERTGYPLEYVLSCLGSGQR